MVRKFTASAAAIAATSFFLIANVEGSDANAQDVDAGFAFEIDSAEDAAPSEVVPLFVANEVVQPLPEGEAQANADTAEIPAVSSLSELISEFPAQGALSEELRCLAGAIYFESRGEPLAGQLAVAQVVINRAESGQFPSSYCGVVKQRAQFSFVKNGRIPEPRSGTAAWRKAKKIARIAHQGMWESEAQDSLYFHANYVRPSWSRKKTARATIKTHIFYR